MSKAERKDEPDRVCERCGRPLPEHECHYVPLGGPVSGRPRSYLCVACYETQRRYGA